MEKFFRLLECAPGLDAIIAIFRGDFGFWMPVAFLAQIAMQISSAVLLDAHLAATVTVACLLAECNLGIGIFVLMMPNSGSGAGGTLFKTPVGYFRVAAVYSVLLSLLSGSLILLFPYLVTAASFSTCLKVLALSSFGGALVHILFVVLPFYLSNKAKKQLR